MKKIFLFSFLVFLLFPIAAYALPVGGGYTSGPDSSYSINLFFFNDVTSTSDILAIGIDGSTAASEIIWDDVWNVSNPAGATAAFAGLDTSFLSITFSDDPDGFNPGELFSFSVDPDYVGQPGAGLIIADLLGVSVDFVFEDLSVLSYSFVDDPEDGAGLVLAAAPVPEPGTIVLMGLGLVGLAGMGRKKLFKK